MAITVEQKAKLEMLKAELANAKQKLKDLMSQIEVIWSTDY